MQMTCNHGSDGEEIPTSTNDVTKIIGRPTLLPPDPYLHHHPPASLLFERMVFDLYLPPAGPNQLGGHVKPVPRVRCIKATIGACHKREKTHQGTPPALRA